MPFRPDGDPDQGARGARPAAGAIQAWLRKTFPGTDAFVKLLDIGPPVGRPVQYRVSGPDIQTCANFRNSSPAIVRTNPHLGNVTFDWNEPARVVKVDVLQDKARQLGVSSQDIASTLNSVVAGASVTQVRDDIYLIDVIARARHDERGSVETLRTCNCRRRRPVRAARRGGEVRLRARTADDLAPLAPADDHGQGGVNDAVQPATVVDQLAPQMTKFAKALPPGY